ncbi:restriction endonuclease subunit S [Acinetobacter johnsonii]|jgi:type I restriction enzyme S subunit|uniref:restriction endonuclease subunit S n=1 Tax=Acinetobacter johnsonii TaxID=40214 RepID=UPI000DF0C4CE|nr:restriction endonuclease subunit S [Acinetobacter johnsonii]AXF43425.1 restriction endonuclease subunit S [Acinetobacter johnsonii]MDH1712777.1 restriction endonuclease subunit S [Acinetobacter johnsonii]
MVAPKLRFKEFDGDWEVNTIQHFLDNNFILDQMDGNHGELYPKSEEFSSAGVPYVSATDFSSGTVNFSQCKRLPLERAALFKKGIAKNGDVLFAHNATVGPVAILETELDFVILSTTATYYRCDGNFLNNYYLKNYFESDFFVQQYFGIMSQSTRNQVPITTQRKLSISIPIIKEQTKIASFLSAVDEKISQLTQKHELLSQYKQGMMQKLFSQQLRFKADDGSEFGEWEEKELHQIFQIKAGGDIEKSSVSEVRTSEFSYPIFANSDKNKGFYGWANKFKYKEAVTVTGRGNLGIAVARNEPFYPIVRLLVLLPLVKQNLKFFEEQINLLDIVSESTGVPQLTAPQLSKYKVNVPSLEEQTKIANLLSAIDQKVEVVAQQIEQAKQWKKGLLQQMFV